MLRCACLILTVIAISSWGAAAFAYHGTTDLEFILSHRDKGPPSAPHEKPARQSISELHLMATGFIRLYQVVLSSQDVPSCNFTPSCSQFTMEAIRKGGFIRGTLLGADRLMRCHWFSSPQYYGADLLDRRPVKIYDPIDWYLHRE